MSEIRISELELTSEPTTADMTVLSQPDETQSSGYVSKRASLSTLAQNFVGGFEYSTLETTAKTIVGAINEIKDVAGRTVEYEQLLEAGTQIGTITIDGISKKVYAPAYQSGDVVSLQYTMYICKLYLSGLRAQFFIPTDKPINEECLTATINPETQIIINGAQKLLVSDLVLGDNCSEIIMERQSNTPGWRVTLVFNSAIQIENTQEIVQLQFMNYDSSYFTID